MKILHITKKYPNALGGDAVVVANLEKQQIKAGHEVVVLTSNCDEIQNGKHIYKFGLKDTPASLDNITIKRLFSLTMLFFKVYRVLKTERPNVIHTHSIDMAFFISFAARKYKIPIFHTFHIVTFNDPRQQGIRSKVELFFLRGTKPKQIFVLNRNDINNFTKAGFPNTIFIPNGVNIEDWRLLKKVKKNDIFTFIAVGRLEEQKGFSYLVEAASKLLRISDKFQIQIVGEGSQQGILETLIEQHNLQNHVYLLGRKSLIELKELYATAHVFILSSLWEGMPITMLEAWASGLPSIVTNVSGIAAIAENIADLVPPADSAGLREAMQKLLINPSHASTLSKRGILAVQEKYLWSIIAKNLYAGTKL